MSFTEGPKAQDTDAKEDLHKSEAEPKLEQVQLEQRVVEYESSVKVHRQTIERNDEEDRKTFEQTEEPDILNRLDKAYAMGGTPEMDEAARRGHKKD